MNLSIHNRKLWVFAVLAVAVLAAAALIPAVTGHSGSDADPAGTASDPFEIVLKPGDSYTYTPSFNIDISRMAVTVAVSTSSFSGCTDFGAAKGIASVGNDKSITIAPTAAGTTYLAVKGTVVTGYPQSITQYIKVHCIDTSISGDSTINAYQGKNVGSHTYSIAGLPSGVSASYTATGLPSGLSMSSAGVLSGTVGSSVTAKSYSVTITTTLSSNPTETYTKTVSVVVAAKMSMNAVADQYQVVGTAKEITPSLKTGTATSNGWSITGITKNGTALANTSNDYKAITMAQSNGKITASTSLTVGTYVISFKAVNTTSGDNATGTAKLIIDPVATLSYNGEILYTMDGATNDVVSQAPTKATLSGYTYSITNYGTSGKLSSTNVTVANDGKVTVKAGTFAVTETVQDTITVKLTDSKVTANTVTATITVVIDPAVGFISSPYQGTLGTR